MNVKSATFNGVKYKIDMSQRIDGMCDSPKGGGKPTLMIAVDPYTKKELETIIHESLHACKWSKSEDDVRQTGEDVARLLWRLGYRRKEVE